MYEPSLLSPPVRIGLLAASRISVRAVIEPAAALGIEVAAVAARAEDRAQAFASEHSIPTAYGSYEAILSDSSLDAIYIGTPASLHAEWAIACLEAGHHVLCEKPMAGNEHDARRMAAVATSTGLVLMEAMHWRYHAFADAMIDLVARLEGPFDADAVFIVPDIPEDDIRYRYHLGGGAIMDLGCYPLHWLRTLLGEPTEIRAEMEVTDAGVDHTATGRLIFGDGSTGLISASFVGSEIHRFLRASAANGTVLAENPVAPQNGNRLTWDIDGVQGEASVGGPSTYEAQLAAFASVVSGDSEPTVSLDDSINNMAVIDEMYRSAGLDPRP